MENGKRIFFNQSNFLCEVDWKAFPVLFDRFILIFSVFCRILVTFECRPIMFFDNF